MTWRIPFAILISSGPILVLINGALGSTGNPFLTAAVLGGSTVAIGLFGHYRGIALSEIDVLFAAFVATVAVSGAQRSAAGTGCCVVCAFTCRLSGLPCPWVGGSRPFQP